MARSWILVLATFCMGAADVAACSCAGPRSPLDAYRSDVLFRGQLMRIGTPTLAEQMRGEHGRELVFSVREWWRGGLPGRVIVRTAAGGAFCGLSPEVGEELIVPAYRAPNGDLHVGLCSSVQAVRRGQATLAALGPGASPVEAWAHPMPPRAVAWSWWLLPSSVRIALLTHALASVLLGAAMAVHLSGRRSSGLGWVTRMTRAGRR